MSMYDFCEYKLAIHRHSDTRATQVVATMKKGKITVGFIKLRHQYTAMQLQLTDLVSG